ncbi:hypothetical protein HF086_011729 [Spodoptera exigua]|nr:hypothetical protein HF086_011729 [Spodoptera exigua]
MPPELQMLHSSTSMQYLQMHPMAQTSIGQMQAVHQASIQMQAAHQASLQAAHQASMQAHQATLQAAHQASLQAHQASLQAAHQASLQAARPLCQHHARHGPPAAAYRAP